MQMVLIFLKQLKITKNKSNNKQKNKINKLHKEMRILGYFELDRKSTRLNSSHCD